MATKFKRIARQVVELLPGTRLGKIVWGLMGISLIFFPVAWHYRGLVNVYNFFFSEHRYLLTETWIAFVAVYLAWHHAQKLKGIANSVSTRSNGSFPRNLAAITDLVRSAKRSIDILADCADYGSFFDPDAHDSLHFAIKSKAEVPKRKVVIRMLVPRRPQPITQHSEYFLYLASPDRKDREKHSRFADYLQTYTNSLRADGNFSAWLKEVSENTLRLHYKEQKLCDWIDECLLACLNDLSMGNEAQVATEAKVQTEFKKRMELCERVICEKKKYFQLDDALHRETFITLLLLRHEWFEDKLKAADVKITAYDEKAALFLWLRDSDIEACFAFAEPAVKERGWGFSTRDASLLNVFQGIFEERLRAAETAEKALRLSRETTEIAMDAN